MGKLVEQIEEKKDKQGIATPANLNTCHSRSTPFPRLVGLLQFPSSRVQLLRVSLCLTFVPSLEETQSPLHACFKLFY